MNNDDDGYYISANAGGGRLFLQQRQPRSSRNNGSWHSLSPERVASPGNRTPGKAVAKSMQLPKWFGALAASVSQKGHRGLHTPKLYYTDEVAIEATRAGALDSPPGRTMTMHVVSSPPSL